MNNQDDWHAEAKISYNQCNITQWISQVQSVFLEEFLLFGPNACPE